MKTTDRVMTTTGSTLRPGDSSVYSPEHVLAKYSSFTVALPSMQRFLDVDLLNMVLELPPAPAALVLLGRWFADFSARSAAAFLRITVAGPPGGLGDAGRAVVEPEGVLEGDVARGEDC